MELLNDILARFWGMIQYNWEKRNHSVSTESPIPKPLNPMFVLSWLQNTFFDASYVPVETFQVKSSSQYPADLSKEG